MVLLVLYFQVEFGLFFCFLLVCLFVFFLRREENQKTQRNLNPLSKDENQQQTQPTCDTRSGNRTQATVVGDEHSHHCAIDAPTNQSVARIVLKACCGMFDPITLTSYVFSQRILLFLFCFGLYCLLHRLQVRLASLLKILKTSKRFVEFHQHAL